MGGGASKRHEPSLLHSNKASSSAKLVVNSSDLEDAKKMLNQQEKELARLRRLQKIKDREIQILRERVLTEKSPTPRPSIERSKRRVVMTRNASSENVVPAMPKPEETRELIWEACLDNAVFADLEPGYKRVLTDPFAPLNVESGKDVVTFGETGDTFYVVESGQLRVYVRNGSDEKKTEKVLGPHSSFGELALVYETPRAATIRADTDCKLWVIKRDDCKAVLQASQKNLLERRIEFLRNVRVKSATFGSLLNDNELSRLASALEVEMVAASDIIVRQGEHGNHFYLVESGQVSVHKNQPQSGRRASLISDENKVTTVGAGGYFGELALINEDVRAASIKAVTDCHLLTLSRVDFVQHLGSLTEILAGDTEDDFCAQSENLVSSSKGTKGPSNVPAPPEKIIRMDVKDVTVCGTLGNGSFGTVRLVKYGGSQYACKCQPKYRIVQENMQSYVSTELKILTTCNKSPFIVKLYCAMQTDRFVYFVSELLPGGQLYTHLQAHVCFSESTVRFYVTQVILAFEYLHQHKVVYRDLKPENLVLDQRGYIKVVDFGLSKILDGWKTWTMCGTPEYLAPEIIKNKGHNHCVDFWMLGVLAFELATGQGPFSSPERDDMEMFELILRMRPKYPRSFSNHLKDLTSKLLTHEKKRLGNSREGWTSVRKHLWFSGFDWDGLEQKQSTPPLKPIVSLPNEESSGSVVRLIDTEQNVPDCPQWTL